MHGLRRGVVLVSLLAGLVLASSGLAQAQEDDFYPLPTETPVTDAAAEAEAATPVEGAATGVEARPVTEVLPSDLAVTGFEITGPLALGALFVLFGAAVLAADRWYRNRLERA